ncbi:MAG: hypothetical protein PHD48_12535, partial [Alphaproteobacteria bacterium]|nr:hypothetical protein [Alphaproteobacteria bacterium]
MIEHQRQVRNLIFFSLLLIVHTFPVEAKQSFRSNGSTVAVSGASGAGGNKVFSVGDVFGSLGHVVGRMLPFGATEPDDEAADSAQPKDHEKDQSADDPSAKGRADDSRLIKAKRLDADVAPNADSFDKKTKEVVNPPYKVYSAPRIPDEIDERGAEPVSSYRSTYRSARTSAPPVDTKAPPALSEQYMRDNLEDIIVNPPLRGALAEPSPHAVGRNDGNRGTIVPDVDSLPKQFFPIFPFVFSQDAREQLLPIASNRALEENQGDIGRAIIIIHDIQRNSAEGVATLMTLAGASNEPTLILAPHFSLDIDIERFAKYLPDNGQNVSRWTMDDPWKYGGESVL